MDDDLLQVALRVARYNVAVQTEALEVTLLGQGDQVVACDDQVAHSLMQGVAHTLCLKLSDHSPLNRIEGLLDFRSGSVVATSEVGEGIVVYRQFKEWCVWREQSHHQLGR